MTRSRIRTLHRGRPRDSRHDGNAQASRESSTIDIDLEERHYSVQQLAAAWGLSPDFVRRLFAREPGVTEWVQQARGRRRYRVLRIPESVAQRVYRRAVAAADPQCRPDVI